MDVREYDPARSLRIGDASVTFAPVVHDLPAWAMRVAAPGAADLGYTGDTGPTADLAGFFAGVGPLVAEATLADPGSRPVAERGSLTGREAGALAAAAGADMLLLTHYWEEIGAEVVRAQAETVFHGRIEVARPGLTLAT